MTAHVRIDGHAMTMRRFVPVQESFYAPYVINGLRIWFDGVRDVHTILNENHGRCFPSKAARFALQDASLPIAPEELRPWCPLPDNRLHVRDAYSGDDAWMGPYYGADAHGGLDINMAIGTPLWAPFAIDDHWHFNSVQQGHNNNRWRGVRRWHNGQRWVIQSHHQVELLIPEHTPLKRGDHYAAAAGIWYGSAPHSHYAFKIGEPNEEILLDPWILFWQIFENNKHRAGDLRAVMAPLAPGKTGQALTFVSHSTPGVTGNHLSYVWQFGDGATSFVSQPQHTYTKPGLYPVTLLVDDGVNQARTTQHITIDGEALTQPSLVLESDEPGFKPRSSDAMDTYGDPAYAYARTIVILAHKRDCPRPVPRLVRLRNTGGGILGPSTTSISYHLKTKDGFNGQDPAWLTITTQGQGNDRQSKLQTNISSVRHRGSWANYVADVQVSVPGALNSPQVFRVIVHHPFKLPEVKQRPVVVVDELDAGFTASTYGWLQTGFHDRYHRKLDWPQGYRGPWRIAAGNVPLPTGG